jgi:hypothetical protein
MDQYCGDKIVWHEARDYEGLRKAIDARRIELRMRLLDLDHDARLQNGYAAKLVCGMRNFGPLTLGPILDALDVDIVLMPRQAGTLSKVPFAHVMRLQNNAALGGRLRRAQMTQTEWSKFCRKAAKARWAKVRKKAKLVAQFGKAPRSKPRASTEAVV